MAHPGILTTNYALLTTHYLLLVLLTTDYVPEFPWLIQCKAATP